MTLLRDRSRIQFVLKMALFAIVLWIVFRDSVMGPVLVPLRAITAEATLLLIGAIGMDGIRAANIIVHPSGFAMEITRGCTGFAGAAILVAGISFYPTTPLPRRLVGIALGTAAFVTINLIRMTHLYYLGVVQSSFFHTAHTVVWQFGMMVAVFALWYGWVRWSERCPPTRSDRALPLSSLAGA